MEEKTVSEIFDEGFAVYSEILDSYEPTNSPSIQEKVRRAIKLLEDATNLVSETGMFSSNESVEEIATDNIKFLLLPYFLGSLTLKICTRERPEVVQTAEIYFHDFVRRCKDYEITDVEINLPDSEGRVQQVQSNNDLKAMAMKRNMKIQQFREKKEMETKLKEYKKLLDDGLNVDDEVKRNYYLTQVKLCINEAIEEISAIDVEKPLLEFLANQKKNGTEFERKDEAKFKRPQAPLKPIIITRDAIQKKVFGAGYPSLPVYSVEEFYDNRVKEGVFPAASGTPSLMDMATNENLPEEREMQESSKEEKIESDDSESLKRAREFDDFKDTHRRGWGNRMNRS